MFEQDQEGQFEQEPVESEENASQSEPPVLSEPKVVRQEAPALGENVESIPEGPAWYVIHCYSGYENKVRHNLEQRIETMGMKDKVFDVVVPTQEEIEVRDGKRPWNAISSRVTCWSIWRSAKNHGSWFATHLA
jgi:transcriptional antiterminator NusG